MPVSNLVSVGAQTAKRGWAPTQQTYLSMQNLLLFPHCKWRVRQGRELPWWEGRRSNDGEEEKVGEGNWMTKNGMRGKCMRRRVKGGMHSSVFRCRDKVLLPLTQWFSAKTIVLRFIYRKYKFLYSRTFMYAFTSIIIVSHSESVNSSLCSCYVSTDF